MVRRRAARATPRLLIRLFLLVVVLALVCVLVLAGAGGFFTYRILSDHNDVENVNPSSFLLSNYDALSFTDAEGETHDGWLLHGRRGGPIICLCHGYDSNRSELLALATMLQENHYNVYLFNFWPPNPKHRISNLGIRESAILDKAIQTVSQQPDINPDRIGLFGRTSGGYASLVVAERNPAIKALVVDNIYETPVEMFNSQIEQLLGPTPIFQKVMDWEFGLTLWGVTLPPVRQNLAKLGNMPKFFLSGRDVPLLAATTEEYYKLVPEPKKLLIMEHSQSTLISGWEKKEYENEILSFFLQNLP